MKCPKCKAENPDTLKFCGECGTQLGTPKDIPVHTKTLETPYPQFSPGTSLADRYEIINELGKGGMGEVYLAEDTNLKRQVAIKVLPQPFALDKERLARFEREARLLASLNHPNIATIHGLEKSNEQQFLVMELVEGETLAERIKKGPLPVDEALELCKQIAEGLESAHEKGIIHRDLKPANVKVTSEGKIKILDFGIAKAFHEQSGDSDLSKSPAITEEMTRQGVILGTAAYMSPEQAKGKTVDKRSDIWAFGCILYECLTGKLAFKGETVSEVMASILKEDPDWEYLPERLPSNIRKLLSRCLLKNPEQRPRDIRDLRLEIADSQNFPFDETVFPEKGVHSARPKFLTLFGILASVVLIAALTGIVLDRFLLNPPVFKPSMSPVRFPIDLPKEQHIRLFRDNPFIAISPDGERIAWISEKGKIFIRELNSIEVQEVTGTEGLDPRSPVVFSLDGLRIGFIRNFTIFEVPVEGGVANRIFGDESMTGLYSFVWGDDGSLVLHFANSALMRVAPGKDKAEYLTTLDENKNEFTHSWPTMLPGSKAVLFAVSVGNYNNTHIEVFSLETGERHEVIENSFRAVYSPTGHLLHARDGTLYAVPFDLNKLQVTGPELSVLSDIQMDSLVHWIPGLCISRYGTLVYIPGNQGFGVHQLVWMDRYNNIELLPGIEGVLGRPVLSPNGGHVAYQVLKGHSYQIFSYDLVRKNVRQLTHEGTNHSPVWSPDGLRLAFARGHEEQVNIFQKPISGSQPPTRIRKHHLIEIPSSWTKNGNYLAYRNRDRDDQRDIWILPMNESNPQPIHLLKSKWSEGFGEFSPDGKWLAYVSNEQDQPEVFIRELTLPDLTAGESEKISRDGGIDPVWSRDGKELFYRSLDGIRLLKVAIEANPFRIGKEQEVLVQLNFPKKDWNVFYGVYDVSLDGERFVAVLEKEPPETMRIYVVLNWFEELKRKMIEGR